MVFEEFIISKFEIIIYNKVITDLPYHQTLDFDLRVLTHQSCWSAIVQHSSALQQPIML